MILIVTAGCSISAPPFAAQIPQKSPDISTEARALVRAAIASIGLVLVRSADDPPAQGPRPRGSGIVVKSSGIIATNHHVITNPKSGRLYEQISFSLTQSGDALASMARYRLKPLLISKEYDLALLAVDANADGSPLTTSLVFPTLEIADSRKIKLLEDLFIIGFPEKGGTSVTVNRGVVEGQDLLGKWIKTDARVIHGNSGGAAVNNDGKLIGIPTKVVADEQPVDKDGDGFPDDYKRYGAVGFLRPSYLLTEMLAKLDQSKFDQRTPEKKKDEGIASTSVPEMELSQSALRITGLVKSHVDGKPIAGALVGLLAPGESAVTEATLLSWGSTNARGEFTLNKPVPPGRYLVRAKAIGHQPYSEEVEITSAPTGLTIEMSSTKVQ